MLCVMSCYLQCHILNWANWQALLLQGTQRCRPLGPSTSAGSISKQGEAGKIREKQRWFERFLRNWRNMPPFFTTNCMPLQPWASDVLHRIARFNRESCIWYHFVSRARNCKTLNLLGSENASRNIPWLEQAQPCGDWAPRVWMFIIFHSGSMLWSILQ